MARRADVNVVALMTALPIMSLLLRSAHAFAVPARRSLRPALRATHPCGFVCDRRHARHRVMRLSSSSSEVDERTTADTLTMEKIYSEWTLEDDRLLYDNRHLPTVRLASLLGRGMHGVEARLKKLTNVDNPAYARLFGDGTAQRSEVADTDDDGTADGGKLTPVKEVLRRIQWDPTLPASSFAVVHYDRVEDRLCETPFDAPNESISGKETRFVFALPEHRIEAVKYLERTVWDKGRRLDCVFGSMNGDRETIDQVIENYDAWKREKDEREERNRRWQAQILNDLTSMLEERRVGVLKDLSSQLIRDEWDREGVKDYVRSVMGLYHDAKREYVEQSTNGSDADDEAGGFVEVADFLYLFSDLVALLPDELLREEILKEVENVLGRSIGEDGGSPASTSESLPELRDEDLEEKFVKGSGAGGQKVNKTSNRVILVHRPTQVRVECQDTRSLQQNRKIARKRLRLKVDEFLNGESSRVGQKASVAVAKKAKNKNRNKRRRQQKKKKSDE